MFRSHHLRALPHVRALSHGRALPPLTRAPPLTCSLPHLRVCSPTYVFAPPLTCSLHHLVFAPPLTRTPCPTYPRSILSYIQLEDLGVKVTEEFSAGVLAKVSDEGMRSVLTYIHVPQQPSAQCVDTQRMPSACTASPKMIENYNRVVEA